jgi:DNA-binding LytR/AlgR family response regulator
MLQPELAVRAFGHRVAGRTSKGFVLLEVTDVWAFEAKGRVCVVHSARGALGVDPSLVELASLLGPSFLRVHRNWLVNAANVRELLSRRGMYSLRVGLRVGDEDTCVTVPIARGRIALTKRRLLTGAVGIRPPQRVTRWT